MYVQLPFWTRFHTSTTTTGINPPSKRETKPSLVRGAEPAEPRSSNQMINLRYWASLFHFHFPFTLFIFTCRADYLLFEEADVVIREMEAAELLLNWDLGSAGQDLVVDSPCNKLQDISQFLSLLLVSLNGNNTCIQSECNCRSYGILCVLTKLSTVKYFSTKWHWLPKCHQNGALEEI